MFKERYNNLNVYNPAKSKLFSGSYIIAPRNPDHDKLGRLYIILELALDNNLAAKISEIIVEVLQKEYYRLNDLFREEHILANFEKALNKTNHALSTLASEGYTDWIDNTHIAVAVIKNNKIHFALTGNPRIFLVRGNNFISINQESENKKPSPMKTFTNITSGTLMSDDILFLATPNLMNFISEEKAKKLILNNKSDVIEYLKHEVPMTDEHSFSAMAINIEKDTVLAGSTLPTGTNNPQKIEFPNLNNIDNQSNPEPSIENNGPNQQSQQPEHGSKAKSVKNIFNKAKGFGGAVISRAKNIKLKDRKSHSNAVKPRNVNYIKGNIKDLPKTVAAKFKQLPKSSQLLLILSLVLAILFTGSLVILKQRKQEINKLGQHEILLNSALEKEQEAQNALIYKDRDKAKELLLEAQQEAKELIAEDVLVAEASNLLDKISGQIDKVEGVTRIEDPLVVANINDESIDSLFGSLDVIYSFDKSNNFIYSINEENKSIQKISEESNNLGYFQQGAMNDTSNSIILLTDSPSFAEFDLGTRSIDELEIDIFNYDDPTEDMKTYGDRLYRLVPSKKQIYKHTRTIAGYSKGVEWALSNTDELENAVSFAIDGFVYVLRDNGDIVKYLRGIKQEFNLQAIQNPMVNPTKIYTSDNLTNLYILEPDKKRVLIFAKNTGNLTIQYTADQFNEIKDLYVDEEEQKLYLLTQDSIYGIVLDIAED